MGFAIPRSIVSIPLSRIGVKPGRRPIDREHVANLAVSFGEIGQRTPISISLVAPDDPQRDDYTYWLNAGGHRFEAAILRGWSDIDAILEDDDALTARIAEVDENLIRRDYTELERAMALAARLEAWSARHPDRAVQSEDGHVHAKRGRPKKMAHGAPISTMGFAEDAAKAGGFSTDTVKRALAVYRGIPAGLQERLLGTGIAANPGALRQLANIADKDEQLRVADVLLDGKAKKVSDAIAIAAGNAPLSAVQTPVDDQVKALRKAWAAATPSARAAWLRELSDKSLPAGFNVTGPADG